MFIKRYCIVIIQFWIKWKISYHYYTEEYTFKRYFLLIKFYINFISGFESSNTCKNDKK